MKKEIINFINGFKLVMSNVPFGRFYSIVTGLKGDITKEKIVDSIAKSMDVSRSIRVIEKVIIEDPIDYTRIKLLAIALGEYGVTEITGSAHNERILQYAKESGFNSVIDDETSWCSIFMNWVAVKCGTERSYKLTARSWLEVGNDVFGIERPGDVVILWREKPSSWKGHVGFFVSYSEDKRWVYLLGGNQSNKVTISKYSTSRILGIRRLIKS